MNNQTKKLLALFDNLGRREQATLIAFAEFLSQRQVTHESADKQVEPLKIGRPDDETVPAALKRLRATYGMLDAADLLSEASELMTQHLMHGRTAVDVIDELQLLFERHYQIYKSE